MPLFAFYEGEAEAEAEGLAEAEAVGEAEGVAVGVAEGEADCVAVLVWNWVSTLEFGGL